MHPLHGHVQPGWLACQPPLGKTLATPESESFVRTFARGLLVIEAMGRSTAHQTVAEVADAAGLPRTAARRFLMTLAELGFVKSDGRNFWLTPKVLRLGLAYLYTLPYWRGAQIALEELSAQIRQSCAISVLDGEDIVYVQRLHTKRILPMSPSLGSRLPAHAVSMGRVLLAGLSNEELDAYLAQASFRKLTNSTVTDPRRLRTAIRRAREQGHAWIDGELDESICGLAVPVRDADGGVAAAINVSLLTGAYDEESAVAEFLPALRQTASKLKQSMQ
jgi:IclR family transcriptional regulator, pca regulon regulatory protein